MMRRAVIGMVLFVASTSSSVAAQDFSYNPPGELVPGSGSGRADDTVYVPGMRFPIENAPAYANSQVWGRGGSQGGGGGECDPANYSYPWWDNYCESRQWDMPLCPSGNGHQGQDIRASTCADKTHWAVAAESGTITNIGSYSVYLMSEGGTQHRYLHMDPASLQVRQGDTVQVGDRLGLISDAFFDSNGNPVGTTWHLHYDLNQNVPAAGGDVYVPTYMSLVRSYETLLGVEALPCGVIDPAGGIVDDFGPCFAQFGPAMYWRVVDGMGHDGRMHWTNAFVADSPANWGRWTLHFAEAGQYRVEIDVVPPYNASKRTRYLIRANGVEETVTIDQSASQDWIELGVYDFAAGGDQKIEVYDNTGETGDDLHITADAVRLTRLDGPGGDAGILPDGGVAPNPDGGGGGGSGPDGAFAGDFDPEDIRVNRGCCAVVDQPVGPSPALLLALLGGVVVVGRRRRS